MVIRSLVLHNAQQLGFEGVVGHLHACAVYRVSHNYKINHIHTTFSDYVIKTLLYLELSLLFKPTIPLPYL